MKPINESFCGHGVSSWEKEVRAREGGPHTSWGPTVSEDNGLSLGDQDLGQEEKLGAHSGFQGELGSEVTQGDSFISQKAKVI
ncbi:hypothetical protein DSO57_1004499 [Entomophthora muscae]|uniref:Uncharacterized protein n=1 Tax=Entomophthora muscae TaxID=34485 RepID=A0ACC2UUS5_9FUNG|nr:hypothetical protein DSO57_1004499 [Entomophthora muscae]